MVEIRVPERSGRTFASDNGDSKEVSNLEAILVILNSLQKESDMV